jgi:hypothetical protein
VTDECVARDDSGNQAKLAPPASTKVKNVFNLLGGDSDSD